MPTAIETINYKVTVIWKYLLQDQEYRLGIAFPLRTVSLSMTSASQSRGRHTIRFSNHLMLLSTQTL